MEFRLRDFKEQDFDYLWSIDQQCFAPGISYSRRELSIYIRRRGSFTLVAELADAETDGAEIVGFIVAESNKRREGHIISIDVLPGHRRSGLGSNLLTAAEERLRSTHCESVMLETAVDNTEALPFYKRQGYSVSRIVPRYYSNGVDAFVLEKNLGPVK